MNEPNAAIADRLHRARQDRGLLQHEVAASLDVALSTYQGWERGNWLPSLRYARKIAKFFGEDLPYADLVAARNEAEEAEATTAGRTA
jgi:transcriptional regulator with XRE-family HTH domain